MICQPRWFKDKIEGLYAVLYPSGHWAAVIAPDTARCLDAPHLICRFVPGAFRDCPRAVHKTRTLTMAGFGVFSFGSSTHR